MLYFIEQFTVLFFALAAAGLVIPVLTRFYKIMVLQLLLSFSVLIGGIVIQMQAPHSNNQWLFNIYILSETAVLLYAAGYISRHARAKLLLLFAFALFLAAWLLQVFQSGIYLFANKAYMLECTWIVLAYLVVLYRDVSLSDGPLYRSPAFWICCGLILFFGCSLPYFGLMHFFQQKNARLNTRLYERLIVTLQNLRYLFIGIAFLLYRKYPSPSTPKHENR